MNLTRQFVHPRMAAIRNEETISGLAARFGVHPTMIANWKKVLIEGTADIFDKGQKLLTGSEAYSINYVLFPQFQALQLIQ